LQNPCTVFFNNAGECLTGTNEQVCPIHIDYFFSQLKTSNEKKRNLCIFAGMRKMWLLILFALNILLLQAQEVKFISVNTSVDTFENINFKRLPKLLAKDSITADTLTEPAKWMVKLSRKLSCKQRKDSNIYIFFVPNQKDSARVYLPLSGKYGYVIFDTAKTSVYWPDSLVKRVRTFKYQWDAIHDPQRIIAWLQGEEEGALIHELTQIIKLDKKDDFPVQTGGASFFTPAGLPIHFADMSKMDEMYITLASVFDHYALQDDEVENTIVADRGLLVAFKYDGKFYIPDILTSQDAVVGTIKASDHIFKGFIHKNYYTEDITPDNSINQVYWYDKTEWKEIEFCYNLQDYINGQTFNKDGYKGAGYYSLGVEGRVRNSCLKASLTLKDLDNLDFFNSILYAKYNPWGEGGLLQKLEDREGKVRLIYSIEENGSKKYYEYVYYINDWIAIDVKSAGFSDYMRLDFIAEVAELYGHEALDIIGFVPVVGEAVDLANGLWYLIEGETGNATLCFASMIPVAGDMAVKSSKYAIKAFKANKLTKLFDLTGESLAAYGRIGTLLKQGDELLCPECLERCGKLLALNPKKASSIEKLAKNITDYGQLKGVLKKVDNFNTTQKTKFLDDLLLMDEVGKLNEELVESWKALGDFPTLRNKIPNLETLEKVKGRFTYNGKTGQVALEEIFTGHKSAQKFIDNFKRYDELIGEVDDITITGIKSSSEVRILNNGAQVGKIVDGKLNVSYSGFGDDIVCDVSKTTTGIGKYNPHGGVGTKQIIDSKLSKSGENPGGVNILNDTRNTQGWGDQRIWNEINQPWLDDAIGRGDNFRAVSDPLDINNVFTKITEDIPTNVFSSPQTLAEYLKNLNDPILINNLSFYGREIRHLSKNNYLFDATSKAFVK
jgi:hypothetical protein